jgi:hypothetical protein
MAEEKFYSIVEFAELINYAERSVRQMCIDGNIKADKVQGGRKWLIPASELERLRAGKLITTKASEDGDQTGKLDSSVSTTDQRHQQQMLKTIENWNADITALVEQLTGKLHIPWLNEYTSLGPNSLPKSKISPMFPFIQKDDLKTKLMTEYLFQHLESAFVSELKNNNCKGLFNIWGDIADEEFRARSALARSIYRETESLTGKLPLNHDGTGPTILFCDTIWMAILKPDFGPLSYDGNSEGEVVKCGNKWEAQFTYFNPNRTVEVIGRDDTAEGAAKYITWHKDMIETRLASGRSVKRLKNLRAKRLFLATEIKAIFAKIELESHIPSKCFGCPSFEQGSGPIMQQQFVKHKIDLPELEERYGHHHQKLFYFGQRLRDSFVLPSPFESPLSYIEGNLPIWGILKKVTFENPEEFNIEKEWKSYYYDARKHPFFTYFQQHLSGHVCWEIMERIRKNYLRRYDNYIHLESEIRERLKPLAGRMTKDGLETLTVRVLTKSLKVKSVWLEDPPRETCNIAELELAQVEEHMLDILRTWHLVWESHSSNTSLEVEIQEFQKALGSDDRLRELILAGQCDLCH